MKSWYQFVLSTTTLALLSACGGEGEIASADPPTKQTGQHQASMSPEEVFQSLQEDGLTCETQAAILEFSEEETLQFGEISQANLDPNQIAQLVDGRETGCTQGREAEQEIPKSDNSEIGTISQAITSGWKGVFVPEGATSGVYASYVYRDSGSPQHAQWMCSPNNQPESPADFVMHFDFQGAWANRSQLELYGQNWWGHCYLQPSNASRVYPDDDVRVCIGYWTTVLCGGSSPQTTDMVLGL
jgi:hypothetical protein